MAENRRRHAPRGPHLAGSAMAYYFNHFELTVSAMDERWPGWAFPIYKQRSHIDRIVVEGRYGSTSPRFDYNAECVRKARGDRTPVVGTRDGYSDLFCPMLKDGRVVGFLVCGAFARSPFSRIDLLTQFGKLTGAPAREGDRELLVYCRTALQTPVLKPNAVRALTLLCNVVAAAYCGSIDTFAIQEQLRPLLKQITRSHPYPAMWSAAAGLVDEETGGLGRTYDDRDFLDDLGIRERPCVSVLALPRFAAEIEADPIAHAVAVTSLQYGGVDLARSLPGAVCGRLAEDGLFLLLAGEKERLDDRRRSVRRAAELLHELGRRHGATMRMGASIGAESHEALPEHHRGALVAAQQAMYEGRALVVAAHGRRALVGPASRWHARVRELCRALGSGVAPNARVDIDAIVSDVLARTGGSIAAARACFEAAFHDAVAALEQRSVLERSAVDALVSGFDSLVGSAPSPHVAATAFREAVTNLIHASEHPADAARAQRVRRAVERVRQSYAEPLTLARVAKEAGLSPYYLSRLFKQSEGVGFEQMLRECRVRRAKELLRETALPMHRVAREAGYRSYGHFARAFRREVGKRPTEYRRIRSPAPAPRKR